jgi:uncharacterized protein
MDTAHDDLTFNVAQLLKEPVGSTRKLDIATPLLTLSDETFDPEDPTPVDARQVKGNVKITRLGDDLLVQGNVKADVSLVCSRCLESFEVPIESTLEERYQPSVDVFTGRPIVRADVEEDDNAFSISANHEIDLAEPVRQALLVALPIRPLHSEDCAGLCPTCGKNLNEGPCDCEPDTSDNRWAALGQLNLEEFPSGNGKGN